MPEWSEFIESKQNIWKTLNEDERIFFKFVFKMICCNSKGNEMGTKTDEQQIQYINICNIIMVIVRLHTFLLRLI